MKNCFGTVFILCLIGLVSMGTSAPSSFTLALVLEQLDSLEKAERYEEAFLFLEEQILIAPDPVSEFELRSLILDYYEVFEFEEELQETRVKLDSLQQFQPVDLSIKQPADSEQDFLEQEHSEVLDSSPWKTEWSAGLQGSYYTFDSEFQDSRKSEGGLFLGAKRKRWEEDGRGFQYGLNFSATPELLKTRTAALVDSSGSSYVYFSEWQDSSYSEFASEIFIGREGKRSYQNVELGIGPRFLKDSRSVLEKSIEAELGFHVRKRESSTWSMGLEGTYSSRYDETIDVILSYSAFSEKRQFDTKLYGGVERNETPLYSHLYLEGSSPPTATSSLGLLQFVRWFTDSVEVSTNESTVHDLNLGLEQQGSWFFNERWSASLGVLLEYRRSLGPEKSWRRSNGNIAADGTAMEGSWNPGEYFQISQDAEGNWKMTELTEQSRTLQQVFVSLTPQASYKPNALLTFTLGGDLSYGDDIQGALLYPEGKWYSSYGYLTMDMRF